MHRLHHWPPEYGVVGHRLVNHDEIDEEGKGVFSLAYYVWQCDSTMNVDGIVTESINGLGGSQILVV